MDTQRCTKITFLNEHYSNFLRALATFLVYVQKLFIDSLGKFYVYIYRKQQTLPTSLSILIKKINSKNIYFAYNIDFNEIQEMNRNN